MKFFSRLSWNLLGVLGDQDDGCKGPGNLTSDKGPRSVRLGLAAHLHDSKPRMRSICFSNQIFQMKVDPFLSSHVENKNTNANVYFNYQECELFKVPHCPEMVQDSCANESKYSDAPNLTP